MNTREERFNYWCIEKEMFHPNDIECLNGLGNYMFVIECIEPFFDNVENPTIMKCTNIDVETASIHCNVFNKNFKMEYDPINDTMYYEVR